MVWWCEKFAHQSPPEEVSTSTNQVEFWLTRGPIQEGPMVRIIGLFTWDTTQLPYYCRGSPGSLHLGVVRHDANAGGGGVPSPPSTSPLAALLNHLEMNHRDDHLHKNNKMAEKYTPSSGWGSLQNAPLNNIQCIPRCNPHIRYGILSIEKWNELQRFNRSLSTFRHQGLLWGEGGAEVKRKFFP